MGSLVVSMPRTRYAGAFAVETAVSKLIGSDFEESEMAARRMASRLSQKLGVAVFVACSFEGQAQSALASELDAVELAILQQRAAALAEKEVYRLLKDQLRK